MVESMQRVLTLGIVGPTTEAIMAKSQTTGDAGNDAGGNGGQEAGQVTGQATQQAATTITGRSGM